MQKYTLKYDRQEFEHIFDDTLSFSEQDNLRALQHFIRQLFWALQFVVIGGALAFYFTHYVWVIWLAALVAFALIGFIAYMNYDLGKTRQEIKQQRDIFLQAIESKGQFHIAFDHQNIQITNPTDDVTLNWKDFVDYTEKTRYIALKHRNIGDAIYIPNSALPPDALQKLKTIAQQNIRTPKKS